MYIVSVLCRHPSLCEPIQYTYQLWSVQNEGYSPIQTTFRHEEIERYNWNYLDNYISSHDSEFSLVDVSFTEYQSS